MLFITRKPGEKVIITHKGSGEKVEVIVNETRNTGHARIGFQDQEHNFKILREEITDNEDN